MNLAINNYLKLMRFDRPIGIFLLLWPTLIGLWCATNGKPSLKLTLIFSAGVVLMRAAGCVINDYADRDFDRHVARTKYRPITAGLISPRAAFLLFCALMCIALMLALQLQLFTISLAVIAGLLTCTYPFIKRISGYPQLVLGIAFAWSIPMIYAEVHGHLSVDAWLIFCATVLWVIAYDTQYALADIADDLRIGIRSTAISFGKYAQQIIFGLQVGALLVYSLLGRRNNYSLNFYLCLVLCIALAIYQQMLLTKRDPGKCIAAFKNNNYFGAVMFIAVCLA